MSEAALHPTMTRVAEHCLVEGSAPTPATTVATTMATTVATTLATRVQTTQERYANGHSVVNGSQPVVNRQYAPPVSFNSGERERMARDAVPQTIPSIVDIKKALPGHCFQPTVARSVYFVVKDLLTMAVLYALVLGVDRQPYFVVRCVLYPVYWLLQGTMMWALFVLGHDCGHGSFSKYTTLNDAVGNVLHGLILVPYYQWKLSHRHHHKNTGNIDKDEIFYPVRRKDFTAQDPYVPMLPYFLLGTSWFIYLFTGYYPRVSNHFNPWDALFKSHVPHCLTSLATFSATLYCLWSYSTWWGSTALLVHYGVPLFVFASWLVLVTFLHHQDEHVPWYADQHWDFVRGNLSSVDRDYGWAHDLTHNIGTHQIHHLFTKIPHYHLEEATRVFRRKFPHLVRISQEPVISSFTRVFRMFDSQRLIDDDAEYHIYVDTREKQD